MPLRKTAVINVVGLTPELLGPDMPRLTAWAGRGKTTSVQPVLPAVTCSAQATYVTGEYPAKHGIVGNGWYFRDDCEIKFWRQSNKLIQAPKIWETARDFDPKFTCANLFWWYNMYSTVNYSVTPRPIYAADGRKFPDTYTAPANFRDELKAELGTFPLFNFWGPNTSIKSSQWIADAAKWVDKKRQPTLSLVYLPHLDYNLQRVGPHHPSIRTDLREIDSVCGDLISFYEAHGTQVIVLSEYGITEVSKAVHLNRELRKAGLLAVREELGLELLDPGASAAFAVADHQIAHVYVNDPRVKAHVQALIEKTDGVESVLDDEGKAAAGLNHERAGDFVAIARPDSWFTYYYWLDDKKAPDFARTVDIHRKPGYDPVELFVDPALRLPKLKVGAGLLKKQLGFRYLLDVIPLDASLVKGSHGRISDSPARGPLFITQQRDLVTANSVQPTEIAGLILRHLGVT
jgi:predicted AlkP superfamily pyrophosphatase or phosphodiesterase